MDGLDDTAAITRCFVALGGNLGNVAETFKSALNELVGQTGRQGVRPPQQPDIRLGRISSNYATPAVGPQAGGGFLNAAAELFTTLSPRDLLARLQAAEASHGRTREVDWGPRTLDLDLVLYGDRVIDSPELQVPHPACWYRRFVLDPMAEIAADVIHPLKRASFADLSSRLLPRPLPVALAGRTSAFRANLATQLGAEFPPAAFDPDWSPRGELPALLAWLGNRAGRPDEAAFQALPLLPRLDASGPANPLPFLRGAMQAALGE